MRLRAAVQQEIERSAKLLGLPTRSELNASHRKVAALERELRALQRQVEARVTPARSAETPARSEAPPKAARPPCIRRPSRRSRPGPRRFESNSKLVLPFRPRKVRAAEVTGAAAACARRRPRARPR